MNHTDWLQPTPSRAAIAAAGLAVPFAVLLVGANPGRPGLAAVVGLASGLPVMVASRSPVAAVALSSVITLAAPLLVDDASSLIFGFIVTLLIYAWGDDRRPWPTLALGFVVLSTNEIVSEIREEAAEPGRLVWSELIGLWVVSALLESLVIAMLAVGLGVALALTRKQAAAMVGLERANGELALEAERHRIARDLHDVAAHHLSSIVVRTSTARKLGDRQAIDDAVAFAGETADEALTAMRQIVTLLRSGHGVTQTRLADLDKIVGISAAAGLDATVTVDETILDRLPGPTDVALSRVLQEALANVVQHSDASTVEVTFSVERTPGEPSTADDPAPTTEVVRLRVSDAGPTTPRRTEGSGLGLIGIRERVEPLGGTFTAGPDPDGGWTVDVTLPLGPPSTVGSAP